MGPGRPQQFCGREQCVLTSEHVSGGVSLTNFHGIEEKAQNTDALPEDPGSIPSPHTGESIMPTLL
ncbi:mCG141830, isoform CRA_a [Mus musculus]|nr:mCG141830, isoform CRA_a [Mus musculus]